MRPTSDPLSDLLRRADPVGDVSPAASARFAAGVHARIQAIPAGSTPGPSWIRHQLLPLAAALALVAALGAGSSLAVAHERSLRSETYAAAYARSVDPWLMHAPAAPAHSHAHP